MFLIFCSIFSIFRYSYDGLCVIPVKIINLVCLCFVLCILYIQLDKFVGRYYIYCNTLTDFNTGREDTSKEEFIYNRYFTKFFINHQISESFTNVVVLYFRSRKRRGSETVSEEGGSSSEESLKRVSSSRRRNMRLREGGDEKRTLTSSPIMSECTAAMVSKNFIFPKFHS